MLTTNRNNLKNPVKLGKIYFLKISFWSKRPNPAVTPKELENPVKLGKPFIFCCNSNFQSHPNDSSVFFSLRNLFLLISFSFFFQLQVSVVLLFPKNRKKNSFFFYKNRHTHKKGSTTTTTTTTTKREREKKRKKKTKKNRHRRRRRCCTWRPSADPDAGQMLYTHQQTRSKWIFLVPLSLSPFHSFILSLSLFSIEKRQLFTPKTGGQKKKRNACFSIRPHTHRHYLFSFFFCSGEFRFFFIFYPWLDRASRRLCEWK